jgi:hypothetical protein
MGRCRIGEKLTPDELKQALPKPPRLMGEKGYDWREFDRYLQRLHALLGAFADGQAGVNLFTGHLDNQTLLGVIGSISTATQSFDGSYLMGIIPNQANISTKEQTDDILTLYWVGV